MLQENLQKWRRRRWKLWFHRVKITPLRILLSSCNDNLLVSTWSSSIGHVAMFILAELSLLVLVNSRDVTTVIPAVTNVPVKVPAHGGTRKAGSWATSREPATLWRPELDGKCFSSTTTTQALTPASINLIIESFKAFCRFLYCPSSLFFQRTAQCFQTGWSNLGQLS